MTFKYGLGAEFIGVLQTLHKLGLDRTEPVTVGGAARVAARRGRRLPARPGRARRQDDRADLRGHLGDRDRHRRRAARGVPVPRGGQRVVHGRVRFPGRGLADGGEPGRRPGADRLGRLVGRGRARARRRCPRSHSSTCSPSTDRRGRARSEPRRLPGTAEHRRTPNGGSWWKTCATSSAARGRTSTIDKRSDLINPSTGEVFATAPVSGEAEVDAAFAAASDAFEGWRDATPSERSLALLRIADALEAAPRSSSRPSRQNTGKPIGLTMSEEIPPMVDQIRFFAGAARMLEGRSAGEYMSGFTSFDPARAGRASAPR